MSQINRPRETERRQIAARLREILGDEALGDLPAVAERLRVGERTLRESLDPLTPSPTVAVLVGVVREYRVDPAWLLTGEYDLQTHRGVLDAGDSAVGEAVVQFARERSTPTGVPIISLLRDRRENSA